MYVKVCVSHKEIANNSQSCLCVQAQLMKMLWRTLVNQMLMCYIQGVPKQAWGEGNELWMCHGKHPRAAVVKLGAFVLLSLSADLLYLCHQSSPIGNWNQKAGQELSMVILKNEKYWTNKWLLLKTYGFALVCTAVL